MTLAYTLETTETPHPTVVVNVPNAETAALLIDETVVWAKANGVAVSDWTFTITL